MLENLDHLIEGTRKRVEEMRRLTNETARLLDGTKMAEEELALSTQHIQDRQAQERADAESTRLGGYSNSVS